jgi:hypothetical protein
MSQILYGQEDHSDAGRELAEFCEAKGSLRSKRFLSGRVRAGPSC